MTMQWTFAAGVLYSEIFLVGVMLLPFLSPSLWQKIFRSKLASMISGHATIYFYIMIAILLMLFAESVRETMKYSEPLDSEEMSRYPEAETALNMKLFRAQRNMYIAGFALFLWFVLYRLVKLIAKEATLIAENSAMMKQAESANAVAQQLLDEKTNTDDNKKNSAAETTEKKEKVDQTQVEKELARTQTELEKTKEEFYKAQRDLETMKKQAESTNTEYDRLLLEHEKLQNQLASVEGGSDKKGD